MGGGETLRKFMLKDTFGRDRFLRKLFIIVGPYRHSGLLENGFIFITKDLPSGTKYYQPSVDGTYAVGFITYASCAYQFSLVGPTYEICKASGDWKQVKDENDDLLYFS